MFLEDSPPADPRISVVALLDFAVDGLAAVHRRDLPPPGRSRAGVRPGDAAEWRSLGLQLLPRSSVLYSQEVHVDQASSMS